MGGGREIKLRVGMQGEKSGFEGYLKSDLEPQCSGNFLKYMKLILMRSLNNGGPEVQTSRLLSTNKTSNTRLHSTELLANGVSWKSLKNPDCC